MTKRELIEFLAPFEGDIKITIELAYNDGRVVDWPVTCAHYVLKENEEGKIILCM